jgi:hypothetical protein
MTIAELLASPAGTPVTNLVVQVARAYQARTVNTDDGQKAVMDIELTDATGQVRASWWSPPADLRPGDLQGQRIIINARCNQRNQLVGAKLKQGKDKNGTPRLEISVSGDYLARYVAPIATPTNAPTPTPFGSPLPPANATPPAPAPAAPILGTATAAAGTGAQVLPPIAPPPPEPTTAWPTNGKLSERDLFAFVHRAANRLTEALTANGAPPDPASLATCVNTMVIAATQGRIDVDPAELGDVPF